MQKWQKFCNLKIKQPPISIITKNASDFYESTYKTVVLALDYEQFIEWIFMDDHLLKLLVVIHPLFEQSEFLKKIPNRCFNRCYRHYLLKTLMTGPWTSYLNMRKDIVKHLDWYLRKQSNILFNYMIQKVYPNDPKPHVPESNVPLVMTTPQDILRNLFRPNVTFSQ